MERANVRRFLFWLGMGHVSCWSMQRVMPGW